jgi:hypothetical protein
LNGWKSELDGVHLIYMPNNVWMDPNIILIGNTPNRILFDPIDTPDDVRTIQIIFEWSEIGIRWCIPTLYAE